MNGLAFEVSDIGPVVEMRGELHHGLNVLRGAHGSGKTSILRTLQLLADGRTDVRPTKRDQTRAGSASFAGKTITIARQTRSEGSLADGIEGLGDLDLGVLHSPKFQDAATRDRHRIAALVRLAGGKADVKLFEGLLPNFYEVAAAPETEDLVEMAGAIKRQIEKAAAYQEGEARKADAQACTSLAAAGTLAETVPGCDEATAKSRLDAAIERRTQAREQVRQAQAAAERLTAARARFDELSESATPVETALQVLEAAQTVEESCRRNVVSLRQQLEQAEARLHEAISAANAARYTHDAAVRERDLLAAAKAEIESATSIEAPTAAELEAIEADIAAAHEAIDLARSVANARAHKQRAEAFAADAKRYGELADTYRTAAGKVFGILSDAIATIPDCPLHVHVDDDGNTRLCIETDRGPHEPFDDLSDGERWRVILPLCLAPGRLVVLPQAAFGELADSSRDIIDHVAREHGAYVLTAQADDGALRIEAWSTRSDGSRVAVEATVS